MKKFSWSTTTTPAAAASFSSNSTRSASSSKPIAKNFSPRGSTVISSNGSSGSRGLVRGSGWPPGGSAGSGGGGVVASFVAARNGGIGSTGSSAVNGVGNPHRVWRAGEGDYHPPVISGDEGESGDDDYDYEEDEDDEEDDDYDDEDVSDEYGMETEDEELTVRGLRRVQRGRRKGVSFALERIC